MTKISKTQLADVVGLIPCVNTKVAAMAIVDVIFAEIRREVEAGNTVALRGFGTFSLRERAARIGRNPRTGEDVQIPASATIGFKPSKTREA